MFTYELNTVTEIAHYEESPFFDKIIDPINKVIYIYNPVKASLFHWKGKTKRVLNDPNYLGYRNGPMPGITNYGGSWWHPYKGKHNQSAKTEYCSNIAHKDVSKDLLSEYGISLKIRSKRAAHAKFDTMDWDGYHRGANKGKGWKRTRKNRQWM